MNILLQGLTDSGQVEGSGAPFVMLFIIALFVFAYWMFQLKDD